MLKSFLQSTGQILQRYAHFFVAALVAAGVIWVLGISSTTAAWYSGGGESWGQRIKITIDADQVDSNLTDFPVYVDLSDLPVDFHTNVASDGGDIRIATADGETEVPREVVSYDAGSDAGELHFKAPLLSSTTDTVFYIYYGNAAATDYADIGSYGRNAVWSDYVGVWHLQESVNNVSDGYADSTGNGNDGTGNSMALSEISGQIGVGQDFDGAADYIRIDDSASMDEPNINNVTSLSMWVKKNSIGGTPQDYVFSKGDNAYALIHGFSSNLFEFYGGSSLRFDAGNVADTTWNHIVTTFDGSTDEGNGYKNGVRANSVEAASLQSANNFDGAIGAMINNSNNDILHFEGKIDEARVRSDAVSADWITAEYTNQSTPSTFYTVGSQEEQNTAPTASDDSASTEEDTAVTINVLSNDTDPESDTLSVDSATTPADGSVVVNGDDTIAYTPDSEFSGTDTFDYTVSDTGGLTDTATVTVTVEAAASGGGLDAYADNLAAVFSTRLAISTYSDALIRIRRSSDDAETDVYPDTDGYVSLASEVGVGGSLETWIGSDTAYVTTIYNQSGATNAVQATTANQFIIIDAGTLSTGDNGKAAFEIAESSNHMIAAVSRTQPDAAWVRGKPNELAGNNYAMEGGSSGSRRGVIYVNDEYTTISSTAFFTGITVGLDEHVLYALFNGSDSQGGVNATYVDGNAGSGAADEITLGNYRDPASGYAYDGYIQEWILWDGVPTDAKRDDVHSNLQTFAGVSNFESEPESGRSMIEIRGGEIRGGVEFR